MPLLTPLLELVTLFNRQKTDLPDGLLRKDCVFRLNARAYHEHLGRPPSDPLVRLVGCGPAGYRFVLAAVRYAVEQPRLTLREDTVVEASADGMATLRARGRIDGVLRGTEPPFAAEFSVIVHADAESRLRELAVTMGDADVELLLAARGR